MKPVMLVALFAAVAVAEDAPAKRDPFQSPHTAPPADTGGVTCRASSCLADEADLHLVGIVSGTSAPAAMVQDSTGRGFVLRRNSPVGANGARVDRIEAGCVHLVRFAPGTDGRREKVTSALCVTAAGRAGGDLDYSSGAVR